MGNKPSTLASIVCRIDGRRPLVVSGSSLRGVERLMDAHTRQHVIGGVVIVIALAHFIWSSQIAEFNSNRSSLRINPTTVLGVRVLGVFLLLMGLLAAFT